MPGVTGYISKSLMKDAKFEAQLIKCLKHYDDYIYNVVRSKKACLASIAPEIDLTIAATIQTKDLIVAYYGQFYNSDFHNLVDGNSVASLLAEYYFRHGDNFADKINGSFIIAVYDKKKTKLVITNDHYASRPLYFFNKQDEFFFSPEIKHLLIISPDRHGVDESSVVDFLVNGYLLNGKTFFNDIKILDPASVLVVENGNVKYTRYEDYVFNSDCDDLGEQYYIKELSRHLMNAVDVRFKDVENSIIPISGGYDSRGILGCVRELTDKKINTVSWGVNEDIVEGDAYIGRLVADAVGASHTFLRRESLNYSDDFNEMVHLIDGTNDDPVFHSSEIQVMKRIRQGLRGSYLLRGDECFGYGVLAHSDEEALARIGLYSLKEFPKIQSLISVNLEKRIDDSIAELDRIKKTTSMTDYSDRKDYFYFNQRLCHYLNRSSYYKMCVLELQNPWLDRNVLNFFRNIPTKYRNNKILYKKTLKTMYPDLFDIPFAKLHSLENWDNEIKVNCNIQTIFTKVLKSPNPNLTSIINYQAVSSLYASHRKDKDGGRVNVRSSNFFKQSMKKLLSNLPSFYGMLIKIALKRGVIRDIPTARILLRIMQLDMNFNNFLSLMRKE